MAVTQAHPKDQSDNAKLKMQVYIRNLSAYPEDAVEAACSKTRQWFPTWAELEEDLELALGGRRHRLAWLERGEVIPQVELDTEASRKALDREMSELSVKIADQTKYGAFTTLPALISEYEAKAQERHIAVDRHVLAKAKSIVEAG